MKTILFLTLILLTFACTEDEKTQNQKPESLIEIKDGIFTEYYPGKKAIKFQGAQDKDNERHGKWAFFAENGTELSITHYLNGKKDGHTIVKYPNGAIYYYGEYRNDQKVGIWKTYDTKGKLVEEKNFTLDEGL
jgi:antitoxin component YwqK of YwqJK toxin-antitoxin module